MTNLIIVLVKSKDPKMANEVREEQSKGGLTGLTKKKCTNANNIPFGLFVNIIDICIVYKIVLYVYGQKHVFGGCGGDAGGRRNVSTFGSLL